MALAYADHAQFWHRLASVSGRSQSGFPHRQPSHFTHSLPRRAIIRERVSQRSALAETVQLYIRTVFENEQYAQLDQAGELNERPTLLRRVFIDLFVRARIDREHPALKTRESNIKRLRFAAREKVSAVQALVADDLDRAVLIGGPGQGKSTLGQYVGQIHRAYLLQRSADLDQGDKFVPSVVRVPFRVILKDYAQWITDTPSPHTLEMFLAEHIQERSGRAVSSQQVQEILETNPSLLILDGLDEVMDRSLRSRMIRLLIEFIGRCDDVLKCNLQVIATSRPTGYSDQFDPDKFVHLYLLEMDRANVLEYTERWIRAKNLEAQKAVTLRAVVDECLKDEHFSKLMTTPLQVTIFILIILSGGTPPRQREELFNEYLEVIYKREKSKSKTIIQTEKRLLLGLHQYLGYRLHRRAEGGNDVRARLDRQQFVAEVCRYLKNEDPYAPDDVIELNARQITDEAEERLVLIVGLDSGNYGFELRSIQEFFAAGYLSDRARDAAQLFARFRAIGLSPHWRNVALFFAGRVGRCFPGEAAHLLEVCRDLDRGYPDRLLRRGAGLAMEMTVDLAFGPDKTLQRSAFEYGLSIVETDLSDERLLDLARQVRQLPRDDLVRHLLPLVEERVRRNLLPEGHRGLVFARGVGLSEELLREAVTAAVRRRRIGRGAAVEVAIELGLAPEYVAGLAKQGHLKTADLERLIETSRLPSVKYGMSLLRAAGGGLDVAKRLFWKEADEAPAVRDRGLDSAVAGRPADPYAELAYAAVLFGVARSLQRALGFGQSADLAVAGVGAATRREELRARALEVAMRSGYPLELRGAGLSVLAALAVGWGDWSVWSQAAKQMSEEGASNEELDRLLFRVNGPPLAMRAGIEEVARSAARTQRSEGVLEMISRSDVEIFVLEALAENDIRSIAGRYGFARRRKPDQFRESVVRFLLRARHVGLPMRVRESTVLTALAGVTDILGGAEERHWRAWRTLERLCMFSWVIRKESRARVRRLLEGVCQILEARRAELSLRPEIVRLAVRLAAIGEVEIGGRLLEVLERANPAQDPGDWRILWSAFTDVQAVAVLWNSVKRSEPRERGFLRVFGLMNLSGTEWRRSRDYHGGRPYAGIKHDGVRLRRLLKDQDPLIRAGASAVAAASNVLAPTEIYRVLRRVDAGSKAETAAADVLIRQSIRGFAAGEAEKLLQKVLDEGSGTAPPIRVGALEAYDRLVRVKGSRLGAGEEDLGLPFQSRGVRR